jgi:hypothetical protein
MGVEIDKGGHKNGPVPETASVNYHVSGRAGIGGAGRKLPDNAVFNNKRPEHIGRFINHPEVFQHKPPQLLLRSPVREPQFPDNAIT